MEGYGNERGGMITAGGRGPGRTPPEASEISTEMWENTGWEQGAPCGRDRWAHGESGGERREIKHHGPEPH